MKKATRPGSLVDQKTRSHRDLPIIIDRNFVLFPEAEYPIPGKFRIGEEIVVTGPKPKTGKWIGTIAMIQHHVKTPGGKTRCIARGEIRVEIIDQFATRKKEVATVKSLVIGDHQSPTVRSQLRLLKRNFSKFAKSTEGIAPELKAVIDSTDDADRACNLVGPLLSISLTEKLELLATIQTPERLKILNRAFKREIGLNRLSRSIHEQVEGDLDEHVRRSYLQEQLRVIKRELHELDGVGGETEEWEKVFADRELPKAARSAVDKELERLDMSAVGSPEYLISHNYLTWIKELPWSSKDEPRSPSIALARKQLTQAHSGLEKVKDRILDHLAISLQKRKSQGQIMLLVGPPGVGKTSLAQAIASSLRRPFVRVPLGGVKDEAEIRGHRRTYIGSMPGKILFAMRQGESMSPVLLLDEIDKIGKDGSVKEVESALLEALDAEQNAKFTDHYLGIPFDLSKVFFVATANSTDTISKPLLDRMEVIEIPSYAESEKIAIAKRHLLPAIAKELGISRRLITIGDRKLQEIIRFYTQESGVRQLRRALVTIARKVVRARLEGKAPPVSLAKALGPRKFLEEPKDKRLSPGVAVGLAYTATGGEIMYIEASRTRVSSGARVTLTGNLGKVIRESAQAAVSYLTMSSDPRLDEIGVELSESHIHIHFPDGGTPKDGPSAGVALLAAIASLFLDIRLPANVAMTGEITLRGQIMAVGGIREKVMAAHRYGKRTVYLPRANASDLADVPPEVRKSMKFIYLDTLSEFLEKILGV